MRVGFISLAFAVLILPVKAQDVAEGKVLFEHYCATCHGLNADGNGPMAPAMALQPKNLTQLAAKNGGEFPVLRVVMRIDGREPLVSHGSDMPVFGDFFEGTGAALKTTAGQPILTSQTIADLVSWLETVQQ